MDFLTVTSLVALAGGYVCGSIPFGLLLGFLAGKGDIRQIGSGNIGATNVLRTGSKSLAGLTLLADILKGTVPALLAASWFGLPEAIAAGFGAFLGHLFPVWLGFKGGKGVATYLGVLLGIAWQGAIIFAIAWLTIAGLTRYSSLSALIAVVAVPVVLYFLADPAVASLFVVMGVFIFVKHRANITRLANGTESRIGASD